jgi:ribonuclease-3
MEAGRHPLEETIGYRFVDPVLLQRALTHRSIASDHNHRRSPQSDYEQLEFLGDAVLGLIVSEALLGRYGDLTEGGLSRQKSNLVSANHLHRMAGDLNLGAFLILGRGEELSGGRLKRALLADALEALIAAIYLDGGLEAARRFVLDHVLRVNELPTVSGLPVPDAKSALQEYAQAHRLPPPRYYVLRETGPDHQKHFTVEVRIGRDFAAVGEGASKKSASQLAARAVLTQIAEEAG